MVKKPSPVSVWSSSTLLVVVLVRVRNENTHCGLYQAPPAQPALVHPRCVTLGHSASWEGREMRGSHVASTEPKSSTGFRDKTPQRAHEVSSCVPDTAGTQGWPQFKSDIATGVPHTPPKTLLGPAALGYSCYAHVLSC